MVNRLRFHNMDFPSQKRSNFTNLPLTESVSYFYKRIKQYAKSVTLGTAFAVGISGAFTACSEQKEKPADQQMQQDTARQGTITDVSGSAVFTVNGKDFKINIMDSKSGQPIQDMIVLLAMKNNAGIYILIDSKNRYTAQIIGIENFLSINSRSLRLAGNEEVQTNVVLAKREECNSTDSLTEHKTPAELFADPDFLRGSHFEVVEGADKVSLSQLDNMIKQIIELTIGQIVGKGIEETIIHVGTKAGFAISERAVGAASLILLAADACDIIEQRAWAKYYRSLCYQDNDQFQIWKFGGVNDFKIPTFVLSPPLALLAPDLEISLITNPIFVVLPVSRNNTTTGREWVPPTATIRGKQIIPGEDPNALFLPHLPMELTHATGQFPPLRFDVGRSGEYAFLVSACENTGSSYELRYSSLAIGPKTTIQVKKNKNDPTKPYTYEVDFHDPQNMQCQHRTFYHDEDHDQFGTEFKRIVSCASSPQHTEAAGDCDDEDAQKNPGVFEQCNGKDDNCNEQIDENLEAKSSICEDDSGFRKTKCENGAETTTACSPSCEFTTAPKISSFVPITLNKNILAFMTSSSTSSDRIKYLHLTDEFTSRNLKTVPFTARHNRPITWNGVILFNGITLPTQDYSTFSFNSVTGELNLLLEDAVVLSFVNNKSLIAKYRGCPPGVSPPCFSILDLATMAQQNLPSPNPSFNVSIEPSRFTFSYPWVAGVTGRGVLLLDVNQGMWQNLLPSVSIEYLSPAIDGDTLAIAKVENNRARLLSLSLPSSSVLQIADQIVMHTVSNGRIAFGIPRSNDPYTAASIQLFENGTIREVFGESDYTGVNGITHLAMDDKRLAVAFFDATGASHVGLCVGK